MKTVINNKLDQTTEVKSLKCFYLKKDYLYRKDRFFLYEKVEVNEITRVETDHNGEIIKIHYDVIENGIFQEYEKEKSCYYRLCLSFTPDHKNMLESEYKPVIISCIEDNPRKHIRLLHQKCEVLKEKQGGYVQMKCLNCGEVHLIALNSWKIYKPGEVYLNTCTDEKE